MARVLHIAASPRGNQSKSLQVAQAFLEEYRRRTPNDEISYRNVFTMQLPDFDGLTLQAKYNFLHAQENSDAQLQAWERVEAVIADFKAADKYVLSIPMWNFGIPYRLKHYLDILVQPGYTFSFNPKSGYAGLLPDRPVVAIYTRGGDYAEAAHLDFQKPYMETILGFVGLSNIKSIVIEPTLSGGPDRTTERIEQAIVKAKELARSF
ncbi:MAG: NAD(P)H-dependent oxidoreductase [Pirellulales bacterium]|nr:NAD(P)H-dependent oxidoreductase [Pirellulales bacterium]